MPIIPHWKLSTSRGVFFFFLFNKALIITKKRYSFGNLCRSTFFITLFTEHCTFKLIPLLFLKYYYWLKQWEFLEIYPLSLTNCILQEYRAANVYQLGPIMYKGFCFLIHWQHLKENYSNGDPLTLWIELKPLRLH